MKSMLIAIEEEEKRELDLERAQHRCSISTFGAVSPPDDGPREC